jgi:hypothetical protein
MVFEFGQLLSLNFLHLLRLSAECFCFRSICILLMSAILVDFPMLNQLYCWDKSKCVMAYNFQYVAEFSLFILCRGFLYPCSRRTLSCSFFSHGDFGFDMTEMLISYKASSMLVKNSYYMYSFMFGRKHFGLGFVLWEEFLFPVQFLYFFVHGFCLFLFMDLDSIYERKHAVFLSLNYFI